MKNCLGKMGTCSLIVESVEREVLGLLAADSHLFLQTVERVRCEISGNRFFKHCG
jgi:hypothetical protein